jgi:hypothetical protein
MRAFAVVVALLTVFPPLLLAPIARAQTPTAIATFPAMLGMPEVSITITDTGFRVPAEIPSGRVLLRVTNASHDRTISADADFVRVPAGTTLADVLAYFGPTGHTATAAGPAPAWVYQATWVGGPTVPPGQTLEAVVDVAPGKWLIVNDWCGSPQQPRPVTATERATSPATPSMPVADVTVQLEEYSFVGLSEPPPAGPHLWQITNAGQQPHFLRFYAVQARITPEQALALVSLPQMATPGVPDSTATLDLAQPGLAVISPGQTVWLAMDLQPGTYLALCLVPDEQQGISHAHLGMAQLVTVGEV